MPLFLFLDKISEHFEKSMGNLDYLKANFIPQRTFKCSHSTIEVDGVLVRVSEDDDSSSWNPVYEKGDVIASHYKIALEDMLQDPAVIRSARVSTGRDSLAVDGKAQGMMNFLWRDNHVTPYESGVVFRFRIETPISFADPLFRLFASFNEFSGRYSNIDTGFYTPQGLSPEAQEQFDLNAQESQELYQELLSLGVAKEMARLCMPYRYYTKLYMTISLRHIMEFLRICNLPNRHVHNEFWEIRTVFENILKCWTPWAYRALQDHPKTQDFSWLPEFLKGRSRQVIQLPYLSERRVLDRGLVRLLDAHGSQELMFTCMDDFPNPLRGFGHGSITLLAHIPIHVLRQWVRHRYGTFTHLSMDYDVTVEKDLFFIPAVFRKQHGKAGSYTYIDMEGDENNTIRLKLQMHKDRQRGRYRHVRALGISPEMARFLLPTCFYEWAIVTKPLESVFNFTSLRTDSHAQREIRDYADAVWNLFSGVYPDVAELFSERFYWGDSAAVKAFKLE